MSVPSRETSMFKNHNVKAVIESCLWEHLVNLMVTGSFLAAICKQIGVSDAVIGVVSSIISITCVAQMFSKLAIRPGKSVKSQVLFWGPLNEFMFATLYIIPFLPLSPNVRVFLFVIMILGAYIVLNVIVPPKYKWRMTFIAPEARGRFAARNEITSLMCGMVFTLIMSRIVDYFKEIEKESTGFIICGVIIFILAGLYLLALRKLDNDEPVQETDTETTLERLKQSFAVVGRSKELRRLLGMELIYQTAIYLSIPFWGTYLIGDLEFSLTAVSIFGILYNIARAVVSPTIGRYADRNGYSKSITLCLYIILAAFAVESFINRQSRMLYAVGYALYAISQAGISSGLFNITFDYIPEKDFANAMGARDAIGGVMGFLVSLLGAKIVSSIQENGNMLFGHTVYAQQLLAGISAVLILVLIIYMKTVVQPMKKQERY